MLSHTMMLRASSEAFSYQVDLRSVTDPSVDPLLPHGSVLIEFTDAVLERRDAGTMRREVIATLGEAGLTGAAGVIANFSMMNRIADATGMPTGRGTLARTADVRAALGLDRFMHD
ncbi:MAG: hypothetical protein P1T08_05020 [Acidimicrobiia bacterium]|nr:hypothetical protein [Acidimicrobiia bacterium]